MSYWLYCRVHPPLIALTMILGRRNQDTIARFLSRSPVSVHQERNYIRTVCRRFGVSRLLDTKRFRRIISSSHSPHWMQRNDGIFRSMDRPNSSSLVKRPPHRLQALIPRSTPLHRRSSSFSPSEFGSLLSVIATSR